MCFFTDIDPIFESDLDINCGYCGNPCDGDFYNKQNENTPIKNSSAIL